MPRGEPASDKFFRILRFFAPTVCAIRCERGRVIHSSVRSFVRSRRRERIYLRGQMQCSRVCESICIVLVSSLSVPRLSPTVGVHAFTVRLCREAISRSTILLHSHYPMRQRFYLIALLCFIEQLLRLRTVCFFTVTTGNSCVCDFWV